MVRPDVMATIDSLSADERREVAAYIETLNATDFALAEDQKNLIRSRDAEMDADPSVGLSREEFMAQARELLK